VRRLLTAGLLVAALAALAIPAGAAGRFTAACAATPLMNNVPRGSELAVEWELCAMTDGRGNWQAMVRICGAGARTTSCAGQRCGQRIAARLHVELSINGPAHAIADSREEVEPVTCKRSASFNTGWHPHHGGGWYCATLWNHDAEGFYAVVPGEVSLGGDRESAAADRARAARGPRAAGKWNSVCLSP
jgi:hypothetical protein